MANSEKTAVLAETVFQIARVRTWRAIIKRKQVWKTARYTKGDIDSLIVGIEDGEGNIGYGYAPAMFLEGESAPSAEAILHTVLKPVLVGREYAGTQMVMREIESSLYHNHQIKFAVEEAMLDLQAKKLNTPLFNLLGGLCFPEMPDMKALTLKAPEEVAADALKLKERGFTHCKLKVGLDPRRDVAAVKAVRAAVGPDFFISIDANQSYSTMDAINVINKCADADLNLAEQPIKRDDPKQMAFVRSRVSVPIMADEGCRTPMDVMRLIEANAVDAVSIKLWNVGGFMKGKEIAALASANNILTHIASTPGSRLMEAGQLHFASSTPTMFGGAELGEFDPLLEDPASGLDIVDGKLKVPMGPGLGIKVDLSNARETTPA